MPHGFAVAEIADWFAVLDHVRNHVELGVFFIEGLTVGIRTRWIELTKIPAESDELGIRERLPMEDDDKSLTPSGFNGVDVGPRQWLGQIDLGDFSA
jgi:hypothetical protein